MTSETQAGTRRFLDAGGRRLALAFLIALFAWGAFLAGFLREMERPAAPVAAPAPLDVRLVELPPAQPAPDAHRSTTPTQPAAPSSAKREAPPHPIREPAAPTPKHAPPVHAVEPPPAPTPSTVAKTPAPPPPSETPTPSATGSARPAPANAAPGASNEASSPGASAQTGEAAGNSAARALVQPLPTLPDDLRENNLQAIALARFRIHPDGSVDVELVRPTPSPRLNQLLLETLRKWRFFPAMRDGKPVESSQDIRVHFNVD